MAGSEVAITVESMFSMNRAQAMIKGVRMRGGSDMGSAIYAPRFGIGASRGAAYETCGPECLCAPAPACYEPAPTGEGTASRLLPVIRS